MLKNCVNTYPRTQSNGSSSLLPAQFSFKLAPLRLEGGDERIMKAKVVKP